MLTKKYIIKESHIIFNYYIQFIITALGLVVALSWNSAFQRYFEDNKYLKKKGPWIYALSVTLLIFVIITILNFLIHKF